MNRGSPSGFSDVSQVTQGFNEAPIHESGKLVRHAAARHTSRASMRPRFMNRGSPGRARRALSEARTRFNEAPIHESGKWGCDPPTDLKWDAASMRPRFMNRGSACRSLA